MIYARVICFGISFVMLTANLLLLKEYTKMRKSISDNEALCKDDGDVQAQNNYIAMVENYNQNLKKEIEEKTKRLQAMQDRMVLGFDHSDTAYCIIKVEIDENKVPYDWSFIYLNDAMAMLQGVRKDEVLNKNFLEIYPDGNRKWLSYYYAAAFENKNFVFEDSPQAIGVYMQIQCFPLDYGYCGCVMSDASTTRDIMQNKIELEMINSALCSDYFVTYVINLASGMTHIYEKSSLFRVMKNRMFVRGSYDELVRMIVQNGFVNDHDKTIFMEVATFDRLKKTMERQQNIRLSYRAELNGKLQYLQTHYAKCYDGHKQYCIMAIKNIDNQVAKEIEQKQIIEDALEEAKQANQAKNVFLSNMSHEIRTPINAVLGMDEMILRESSEAGIREYAQNIKSAGRALLSLINDILDFSKIESGKMNIIPVEYDVCSLVNDVINMNRPKAYEKGLEFEVEINHDMPHLLYGDEVRIRQIIVNILSNAVKYTEKGKISLKLDYQEGNTSESIFMRVTVADTGKGIKQEDLDKLFSPFERIEEKRNRSIEGTGLGMSISKQLLDMMSSRLEVSSVYGEGSVFSFCVEQKVVSTEPVSDFEKKFQKILQEEYTYKNSFRAPEAKILVVDDVVMNLQVVANLLKPTAVKLDLARSGKDCLELSDKKKYDMIFMDHMMPEMDGFETLEQLRKSDGLNVDTPVIVLTANVISGAKEKYLDAGFCDYLSKPIDIDELENMIARYLPTEKIIYEKELKADTSETELADMTTDKRVIYTRLSEIAGIDTVSGVKASGSVDTYLQVAEDFANTGNDRLTTILSYFEQGDWHNYTIQVHALKSVSRLIGYMEQADLAEQLEQAGNSQNKQLIEDMTPKLLNMLRAVTMDMQSIFDNDADKPPVDPAELADGMNTLREVLEFHDYDSADMIVKELSQYQMPEVFDDTFKRLKVLLVQVDRNGMIELLENTRQIWMGE